MLLHSRQNIDPSLFSWGWDILTIIRNRRRCFCEFFMIKHIHILPVEFPAVDSWYWAGHNLHFTLIFLSLHGAGSVVSISSYQSIQPPLTFGSLFTLFSPAGGVSYLSEQRKKDVHYSDHTNIVKAEGAMSQVKVIFLEMHWLKINFLGE